MVRIFVGHPWNISIPDRIPIIVQLSEDEREMLALDIDGTLKKIRTAQKYLAWLFSDQCDLDNALARKNWKKTPDAIRAVGGLSPGGERK